MQRTSKNNAEENTIKNELKSALSRNDEVFELLEKADVWCSGEEMSKNFNISRAAISKHINILRENGHIIQSSTNKGYKLIAKNIKINATSLKNILETQVLGRNEVIIFDNIGSSNQEAMIRALNEAQTGTLIIAENQEKGRGTKNRTWFSAPRSLQFSIILRSEFSKNTMETLTQITLSAIAKTIEEATHIKATIKQPNDIIINQRKVCGLLIETVYRGTDLECIILGIGININALKEDFPKELHNICTSLFIETGIFYNRTELLALLLKKLEIELM